jgi:hypothetical protein
VVSLYSLHTAKSKRLMLRAVAFGPGGTQARLAVPAGLGAYSFEPPKTCRSCCRTSKSLACIDRHKAIAAISNSVCLLDKDILFDKKVRPATLYDVEGAMQDGQHCKCLIAQNGLGSQYKPNVWNYTFIPDERRGIGS